MSMSMSISTKTWKMVVWRLGQCHTGSHHPECTINCNHNFYRKRASTSIINIGNYDNVKQNRSRRLKTKVQLMRKYLKRIRNNKINGYDITVNVTTVVTCQITEINRNSTTKTI